MTLLDSKKAGSQTEPLKPLLDNIWSSSGAFLQLTVLSVVALIISKTGKLRAVPEEAKDAEEGKGKTPGSEAGPKVKGRPRGHPRSTNVDEEKINKPVQGRMRSHL